MGSNASSTATSTDGPLRRACWHLLSILLFIFISGAVLGVDLYTKELAFQSVAGDPVELSRDQPSPQFLIPPHDHQVVIPYILSLKLTVNTGAIFGLGKGAQWFFVIVTVFAVGSIIWLFAKTPVNDRPVQASLALILAGALGNLHDRIRYNAVRDLLYLFPEVHLPFGLTWPSGNDELYPWIFNIADVALVVGVAVMTWTLWRRRNDEPATAV